MAMCTERDTALLACLSSIMRSRDSKDIGCDDRMYRIYWKRVGCIDQTDNVYK